MSQGSHDLDVILVTDDPALRAAVLRSRGPGATCDVISREQFCTTASLRAAEVWLDLEAFEVGQLAELRQRLDDLTFRRRVYFHSEGAQAAQGLPPGLFLYKPCSATVLSVVWSGIERRMPASPRSSAIESSTLPSWLVFSCLRLDLRELCHTLVTRIPPRLGYRDALLYLYDPAGRRIVLAETTFTTPVDLSASTGTDSTQLLAHALTRGVPIQTDDVAAYCRRRNLTDPRRQPEPGAALLLPLIDEDAAGGVLMLTGAAPGEPLTIPMESAALLLGKTLRHAQTYATTLAESRIDGLTSLYNYRGLTETLAAEIGRCRRFGAPLSVLMLDIDGLKEVNDTLGHSAGDALLRHVASKVRAALRQIDSAARIGGDEFVVLLPATELDGAALVAERIAASLRDDEPSLAGKPTRVSASIGVSAWQPGMTAETLLSTADTALYDAKFAGGAQVRASSRTRASAAEPVAPTV